MIISRGRAYVFVHIPKTGGTSLSLALEQRAMKDDILIGDTPKAIRRRNRVKSIDHSGQLRKHATLADLDELIDPSERDALFTFTLVRNPWDRMVSYYHWLQEQSFDHPAPERAKKLSFEAFVLHPDTARSFRANPARQYMTWSNGIEHCNAYIRLEYYERDAAPLFDHLGFRVQLPHLNASKRTKDYRTYYSSRAHSALEATCREDINRFGYTFDPPTSQSSA